MHEALRETDHLRLWQNPFVQSLLVLVATTHQEAQDANPDRPQQLLREHILLAETTSRAAARCDPQDPPQNPPFSTQQEVSPLPRAIQRYAGTDAALPELNRSSLKLSCKDDRPFPGKIP